MKPGARSALHRVALGLTIAVACAVSMIWAFSVPMFAQPDELAHADYAFALSEIGEPFHVRNAKPNHDVTPEERYLARVVRYRENRYATVVNLPDGYGTAAFFKRVDRGAPPPRAGPPASGSAIPYVMLVYPFGYYLVDAAAMRLGSALEHGSLSARFFAGRLVGVVCLPITLAFGYGVLVRSRLPRRTALVATAAIGLLPLTLWVSGYIQPDVLTTTLVTASLYWSLRWKEEPRAVGLPIALGFTLTALAVVKQHYAFATIAATSIATLCTPGIWFRKRTFTVTFATPVLALFLALHYGPAGPIGVPRLSGLVGTTETPTQRLVDFVGYSEVALRDAFVDGDAFKDFWWRFGLHGDSVLPTTVQGFGAATLIFATLVSLMLFIIRSRYVLGRIFIVYRRRSWLIALRLVVGDPVLNVYILVTAILVAAYALSDGLVWLEGRYWLPVIVPLAAIELARNVRMLRPALRDRAGLAIACAWAAYSIATVPLGIQAIERDFYEPSLAVPTREPYAEILDVEPDGPCPSTHSGKDITIREGCRLVVSGYAVDGSRGLPARAMFITVDGKSAWRARVGLPSQNVRDAYNDDQLANAGFLAKIGVESLRRGHHTVGISIVENGNPRERMGIGTIGVTVR